MAKVRSFSQLRSAFTWDPGTLRYRSASGSFVSAAEVKRATLALSRAAELEIRRLAQQLATGQIELSQWQVAMSQALKDLHLSQAALGRGGLAQLTRQDFSRIGGTLRYQYDRLRRFGEEVEAGIVKPGQIENRSAMYARSGNSTFEQFKRYAASDAGFGEERRRLGSAEHCVDCVAAAQLGWQPLGSLPRIGESVCRTNCKCTFVFR